jgi:CRP/FNR family transcriptional regulator, cyclic AMP receptor protein
MKEFAYIHEEGKLPDLLANVPFFGSFTAGHLNDILYSSYFIQCDPGDRIIEQGQEDQRIFILLHGEFDVLKDGEPVASITDSGEVFGEVAVVSGERRSATVIARKPTLCLVIDQQFLQELKPEKTNASYYAALYGFLSRILAARLQTTAGRLAEVEHELEQLRGKRRPSSTAARRDGGKPARGKRVRPPRKEAGTPVLAGSDHQRSRKTSRKK